LVLEDGREVRLAAIEVAPLAVMQNRPDRAGRAAAAALSALAVGDQVVLRRAESGHDRYGRLFAYAYILREGDEFLLQQELVADGHARVSNRIASPCAGGLFWSARRLPARPNLAYGPIRIMRCLTPKRRTTHWR